MRKIGFFMLLATWLAGCGVSETIPAVENFELARYLGKWYEIARTPNYFERGLSRVTAEYSRDEGGEVKVVNSGVAENGKIKSITGRARFAGKTDVGELKVSFFGPFFSAYRIVKLAVDYRYAVVVGSDLDYVWVLARSPQLAPDDWREIAAFLRTWRISPEKLIYSFGKPEISAGRQ